MRFLILTLAVVLAFATSPVMGKDKVKAKNQSAVRSYYLTQESHFGDDVLSACSDGYHFASIWEIRDFSNFKYDVELGYTTDYSGYGPPPDMDGWLQSGFDGSPTCDNWTSTGGDGMFGRLVFPEVADFLGPPGDGWLFVPHPCGEEIRVWCVSD